MNDESFYIDADGRLGHTMTTDEDSRVYGITSNLFGVCALLTVNKKYYGVVQLYVPKKW